MYVICGTAKYQYNLTEKGDTWVRMYCQCYAHKKTPTTFINIIIAWRYNIVSSISTVLHRKRENTPPEYLQW